MYGSQTLVHKGIEVIDRFQSENRAVWAFARGVYDSSLVRNLGRGMERCFDTLTVARPSEKQLRVFANNFSILPRSGEFIAREHERIVEQMAKSDEHKYVWLGKAAHEISIILSDEFGSSDLSHPRQYDTFAEEISGSQTWKHCKYQVPEVSQFNDFLQKTSVEEPLDIALVTTAAHEIWEVAVCSYFYQFAPRWAQEVMGMSEAQAHQNLAFFAIHAGEIEISHAFHALRSWQLLGRAYRWTPEPQTVRVAFMRYFEELEKAFGAFQTTLFAI